MPKILIISSDYIGPNQSEKRCCR